jgi:hypothetical protein
MMALTREENLLPEGTRKALLDLKFNEYMANERIKSREMRKLYSQKYKKNWPGDIKYGVCDYPEQVFEKYPHFRDDDIKRIVTCVEVRRENEVAVGGWRYHKWGKYIGKQRPQSEYLYHDTHIDAVWTFHIYEVDV